jgi:hypothetical protein
MADRVRRVNYVYVVVPNRPGQGARITNELREAGVNLLAYTAFPTRGRRASLGIDARNRLGLRGSRRRRYALRALQCPPLMRWVATIGGGG